MRRLSLLIALAACSSGQVARAATVAEGFSAAYNRAGPLLVAQYDRECRGVIDRQAEQGATREQALVAFDDCKARWLRVRTAFGTIRRLHDAWVTQLDACRARDGGACGGTLAELQSEFNAGFVEYRCAVRAAGRPDLDPYPGELECAPARAGDGGRDGH